LARFKHDPDAATPNTNFPDVRPFAKIHLPQLGPHSAKGSRGGGQMLAVNGPLSWPLAPSPIAVSWA